MAKERHSRRGPLDTAEITYHAIVLRRRDAGESDRRLTLLTREAGVVDVVAKGARKGGSRLSGISEPLSACIIHVASGKKNAFVTQAQPISSFPGLRADYSRLSFGLALAELGSAVLPHEQEAEEAFTFFVQALRHLEAHSKPIVALAWAEIHLLALAGFLPSFASCVVTGSDVLEALPFLSPHAGGYVVVSEVGRFTDRFQTRAEVLYGLSRLSDELEPPSNLRFASESILALLPFWRAIAERPLPANESVAGELRADASI